MLSYHLSFFTSIVVLTIFLSHGESWHGCQCDIVGFFGNWVMVQLGQFLVKNFIVCELNCLKRKAFNLFFQVCHCEMSSAHNTKPLQQGLVIQSDNSLCVKLDRDWNYRSRLSFSAFMKHLLKISAPEYYWQRNWYSKYLSTVVIRFISKWQDFRFY